MSETPEKPSQLGRGLSSLLGEDSADYASLDKVRLSKMVPIEFLHPNRYQPRHRFDEDAIAALVESIKDKGIIQPIIVRRHPETPNAYEIVAGERRWRAAQKAQLHEVPVIIKDLTDSESLEVALVENIQRQNLSPLEEAEAYQRLMAEFSYVQEELGRAVGKSRSHIANTIRLLGLPDSVKGLLDEGALSAGHGRALLNADDPQGLARKVVKDALNVRQTERLAQPRKPRATSREAAPKDPNTVALERDLSTLLGLKVTIKFHRSGGALTVHYKTLEQLDDVLHRLQHSTETGVAAETSDPTMPDAGERTEAVAAPDTDGDAPAEALNDETEMTAEPPVSDDYGVTEISQAGQDDDPLESAAEPADPFSNDAMLETPDSEQHPDADKSDQSGGDEAPGDGPAKSEARSAIEELLGDSGAEADDTADDTRLTEQTEPIEPIEQGDITSDTPAESEPDPAEAQDIPLAHSDGADDTADEAPDKPDHSAHS